MPGPSNTLLIEGSFSELSDEVAQYIDTISKVEPGTGVQADIEPLLAQIREKEEAEEPSDPAQSEQQRDDVLKKIVGNAAVLNSAPEKEFTAAYNLLIHLSNQSPARNRLLARMCQYLSEQPITSQFGPSLAISTLTTIFNTLPTDEVIRYNVFLTILRVIRATSSAAAFEALIPQLQTNLPEWLESWQLDDDDVRNMHVEIADVAAASGNFDLSYEYLLRGLESIPSSSASEPETRDVAKRTLITALTNPSVTDFTPLTTNDAILALKNTDSALIELLEIFSSDDFSSYNDFLETTSLSTLGIPESAANILATKIRLLTLATIAASAQNRSVPYNQIAKNLEISSEDVEMWVIDTIRAGLVEGKLSQLKQEFLVQRATYRHFGEKQWTEIQGRLMVWRRSLESVLNVVRSERERFARDGPGGGEDVQGQQTTRMNGYGADRRQGQRKGQMRDVDFVGAE